MAEIKFRECLRNHAASIGVYTIDGCGEFLNQSDGNPLLCAVCGCHRNFHRQIGPDEVTSFCLAVRPPAAGSSAAAEVAAAAADAEAEEVPREVTRTILTDEQKMRMKAFAEKLGWKLQGSDPNEVESFCCEIGICRRVFKVWMGNHRRRKEVVLALPAASAVLPDAPSTSQ